MKKLFVGISGLCITLLAGCGTAGLGSHPEENLAFPFDVKEWQVGRSVQNGSERTAEFVVRGEKIENWTRLVTMQSVKKQSVGSESLESMVDRISRTRSGECPGFLWNVIARGEGSILYEWKSQNCPEMSDRHVLVRFLDGKYNRFRISYEAKVKTLSPEERDKWIKLLSEASILGY